MQRFLKCRVHLAEPASPVATDALRQVCKAIHYTLLNALTTLAGHAAILKHDTILLILSQACAAVDAVKQWATAEKSKASKSEFAATFDSVDRVWL
jgi:hypothetical protein